MKPYLLLLATIAALSISYYFAIALPANNRAFLDFEKEKYRNEQAEMKAKQLAQEQETQTKRQNANTQARMLAACLDSADQKYNHSLALNGPKTGPDVYSVETRIVTMLSKQRSEAISECRKEFGQIP